METVYKNPYFKINKRKNMHFLARDELITGSVILPQFENEDILLVIVWREALDQFCLELPRGGIDKGESPATAAKRELREETGVLAKSPISLLGTIYPDSGVLASEVYLYHQKISEKEFLSKRKTDKEIAGLERVSLKTFKSMIKSGLIKDSFTLAAFSLFLLNQ